MYNFHIALFDSRREKSSSCQYTHLYSWLYAEGHLSHRGFISSRCFLYPAASSSPLLVVFSQCLSSQGQQGMIDTILCLQYPYFNHYLLFWGWELSSETVSNKTCLGLSPSSSSASVPLAPLQQRGWLNRGFNREFLSVPQALLLTSLQSFKYVVPPVQNTLPPLSSSAWIIPVLLQLSFQEFFSGPVPLAHRQS